MDTRKLLLDPSAIAWRLALVVALMVAANLGLQAYRLAIHRDQVSGLALVAMDGEQNLPALFSTGLLFCASALLALIALLSRRDQALDVSKWAILATGFLVMGLDEALSFHERLIEPMRALLGRQHLGIFFFAWVIPGISLVAALGAFFLPFVLRLPRRTAIAFVMAAAIYLGGALGVELVEGWWREGHGHKNLLYHVFSSLEEGMEMTGIIVFIHTLLRHIGWRFGEVRFAFDGVPAAAEASGTQSPEPGQSGIDQAALLRSTGE
ncbi:hypothetical protein [Montanilutibacter psychrotolerans]|uniref:Uncharacterized protein n=1 Tax=Montanilutibacter psychrotolerans TaxID=1327343 RepID=A0A3M8SRD6_9GAMM|nr:hypothetical protein [Lysobacter psychrotolerans]RNF83275.1 hypothetical protein EER27_12345 [Lysobacter psychrotolerans]